MNFILVSEYLAQCELIVDTKITVKRFRLHLDYWNIAQLVNSQETNKTPLV